MKTMKQWMVAWALLGMAAACDAGQAGSGRAGGVDAAGGADGADVSGADLAASEVPLTEGERALLVRLREEEKLARDVYAALDGYGNPFLNIQASEQRHMDAVLALLDAYGVDDPAAGRGVGVFNAPELQALHDALVAQGSPTLEDALGVDCAIERLDIEDIEAGRPAVVHADVLATLDLLEAGSNNHLDAFSGRLQALGSDCAP